MWLYPELTYLKPSPMEMGACAPRRYRAWREHESLSCRVVMGPATELWQGVEGDEMRHRRSSLVQHSD